jgi:hypothetical protein
MEIITVYFKNQMKVFNTPCKQNAESLNVKASDKYNYHYA